MKETSGERTDIKLAEELDRAIAKARQALFALQSPEGYWSFELHVDVLTLCDYLLYYHWRGKVDEKKQEQAVRHLLKERLPDGGWNLYHGGPSEINLTVKGYLVLKLAGHDPESPEMRKTRETILRLGGVDRMNTYSKLMLALLGLYPWRCLPCIPCEMTLLPNWFPFNIYELSSWSRNMVAPLSIINHFRPIRPLPERFRIDELYPEGPDSPRLGLHRDKQWFTTRNFFLTLDRALKIHEGLPFKPLRKAALKTAERWILERIGEGSDGMGAIFPAMVYTLIALEALGYDESHPLFAKALKDLQDLEVAEPTDDSLRVRPCFSPTWDTAISILSLTQSGASPNDPRIVKAVDWLLDKEIRRFGDWRVKNPYPEASGWAFEFNNEFYPDVDDTAMVLLALHSARASDSKRHRETIERATRWTLSFQCKNGGFAAFDKDVTKPWLEKIPFADHNAILDPPSNCISGRILEWLGRAGFDRDHPAVKRTVEFLRAEQDEDGSWFGRWGVNYIYGTWQALRGLRAVGIPPEEPWMRKAVDWLKSRQNPDGGWGETAVSYEDPRLKAKGPSGPSQTAWALLGIMACEEGDRESLRRGIDYLLRTQAPDGAWPETTTNGAGFPKVYYLRYDVYRYTWPLLALAEYRKRLARAEAAPQKAAEKGLAAAPAA
ncbi:MAG: squalene--hopene cyclase [Verrucomicrobia bacterium]|nr:squalene--hopene cyclase [Verrucomicrobiota bacterium]